MGNVASMSMPDVEYATSCIEGHQSYRRVKGFVDPVTTLVCEHRWTEAEILTRLLDKHDGPRVRALAVGQPCGAPYWRAAQLPPL